MPVVQRHINSIPMEKLMCTKMIYQPGTLRKLSISGVYCDVSAEVDVEVFRGMVGQNGNYYIVGIMYYSLTNTMSNSPSKPTLSVMVGGKQIPRLFSRNTLRIKPRSVRGTD